MAHDVFISYSSKDKPIADGICANLEAAGLRCWIAPRDIRPGEEWPKAITNAISQSRVMVLVFSTSSNSSKDVGREIVLAANHDLVIIPFKIENIEPEAGKQYYLAQTHWLEAMNPPTREHIHLLVDLVKTFVPAVEAGLLVQPETGPKVLQPGQPVQDPVPAVKNQPAPWKLRLRTGMILVFAALLLIMAGAWGAPSLKAALSNSPTRSITETLPLETNQTAFIQSTLTPIPSQAATSTKVMSTSTPRSFFSLQNNLKGHTLDVSSLAFSPDGLSLASGSYDYYIKLWDIAKGEQTQSIAMPSAVESIAFSPGGELLAVGTRDGKVRLFDTTNWGVVQTLTGHTGGVVEVIFSPDGLILASGSNDSSLILWNTTNWSKLRTINDHTSFVLSIAFSPDGNTLASGGYQESTIMLNDITTGTRLQTLNTDTDYIVSVTFSSDGNKLASASKDGTLILWDATSWKKLRSFSSGTCLAFSPDGRTLASGSWEGRIILREVSSGSQLQALDDSGEVTSVAYSPDGRRLASGSKDGTIKIWTLGD